MWSEILAVIGSILNDKNGSQFVATLLHDLANIIEDEAANLDQQQPPAPAPTLDTTPAAPATVTIQRP